VTDRTVCFVAHLEQDNLGVGYLASMLLREGRYRILLADAKEPAGRIIESVVSARPLLVGFSIVFQGQLETFRSLASNLRAAGVSCHFTAGGHYPSLRYEELMRLVPELDSVVLFEGEHTIVELAGSLHDGREWRGIAGLARRDGGGATRNALRPLEEDLDAFPPPVRRAVRPAILGRKAVNLLAGRGCLHRCSFCSIQRFYAAPPGRAQRVRGPSFVAREMQLHCEEEGCSVFLFQDDAFPVSGEAGRAWVREFCAQLRERKLAGDVLWKISCRANDVDRDLFRSLKDHGLGMVYLGIESGTRAGLAAMNKGLTPEVSLRACDALKELDIPYEFGFMLFEPYSSFDSLQGNVEFLAALCGDGTAAVALSKMLALAGTNVEDVLRANGRLHGHPPYEDYRFLDPALDDCYEALAAFFRPWMHDERGCMNLSRYVRLQVEIFRRFHARQAEAEAAGTTLNRIVAEANRFLLETVLATADSARTGSPLPGDPSAAVAERHAGFCARLSALSRILETKALVQ
jgi:anaerobic magnesium-protoporphyrin IX monomethyl ester cyclase